MQLVLASTNIHKILELKSVLKRRFPSVDIFSLRDFPDYKVQEESGSTFAENAEAKALTAANALGCYVLADDSGLVIPSLGGEPGIYSRRYAGPDATEKENREKLIEKMKLLPLDCRTGYFECALSFASPGKILKTTKGKCEGSLLLEPRGNLGFGYDSLFIKYDYNKTMGELDPEIKNRISHRRKALDKLLVALEVLEIEET